MFGLAYGMCLCMVQGTVLPFDEDVIPFLIL